MILMALPRLASVGVSVDEDKVFMTRDPPASEDKVEYSAFFLHRLCKILTYVHRLALSYVRFLALCKIFSEEFFENVTNFFGRSILHDVYAYRKVW